MRRSGRTSLEVASAVGVGLASASAILAAEALSPRSASVPRALVAGLIAALIAWVAMGIISTLIRRRIQALSDLVSEAAEKGSPAPLPAGGWLSAFFQPVDRAMKLWAERCSALNAQLRTSEIRFSVCEAERLHAEATLHALRDAVIVTDAFNEVTLANEPAASLLGFDLEAASHRPIDEVLDDPSLKQMIKEVRQSGVVTRQKRVEHEVKDPKLSERGIQGTYDVTIACLPDQKQQSVGGVVTILRDITKEKEISEMKSDFVSQASHELRTPLSSINAYVELLLDSEAQDEASRQEFYQIIKAETDRVTRMIDNMLNISRIEAGIVSVDRTAVDFGKLSREVIETLRPQANAKSIKLIEKIGPLMYTAEADRDMMYQVLVNLVTNAIKYTPEGGRITVGVENDDESSSVLISVADTGLGIPPDAQEKLFEKFYRVENYKRIAKGTGLGLNLVKHIVETVHRGAIGVSSEVGMGSRFWFTVPYEFQGG